MRIKQWILQRIANRLLKGVRVLEHEVAFPGCLRGYTIQGDGWWINTPGEPAPEQAPVAPYVPKYPGRTSIEHEAIRKRIQVDPATCQHLKGGRLRSGYKDYNVSCHTFINGETKIRCLSCRRVWTSKDPDGKEALLMVKNSTNARTSSEVPMLRVTFSNGQDRIYQNKEAVKKDFPDYDGHVDN